MVLLFLFGYRLQPDWLDTLNCWCWQNTAPIYFQIGTSSLIFLKIVFLFPWRPLEDRLKTAWRSEQERWRLSALEPFATEWRTDRDCDSLSSCSCSTLSPVGQSQSMKWFSARCLSVTHEKPTTWKWDVGCCLAKWDVGCGGRVLFLLSPLSWALSLERSHLQLSLEPSHLSSLS